MQPRDLSAHAPYVPGKGIEEVARELGVEPDELVKLSSNENPHGPSPAAVEAAQSAAEGVHHYPKASHTDLTVGRDTRAGVGVARRGRLAGLRLASGVGTRPGSARPRAGVRLLLDEHALPPRRGDDLRTPRGRRVPAGRRDRALGVRRPTDRLRHLPAQPDRDGVPTEELRELLAAVDDDTLVAVDEAYGEYTERASAAELLDEYDNLAVTRTFSKAYGLAGLRIGYALVPASWGEVYAQINTPFAANEVGLRAALAALDDDDHVEQSVETAAWAREYMAERLGVPTVDGAGNFLLAAVGGVETEGTDVAAETPGAAVAAAAKRRGVIVRATGSFGLPEHVRISCGTREETRTAVETLNDVFAELEATAFDPDAAGPPDAAADGGDPSTGDGTPQTEGDAS